MVQIDRPTPNQRTRTARSAQPSPVTLHIPCDLSLTVSVEDFVQLARMNRDLRLERTAQGKLIVNPPTGWQTGNYNAEIVYQLVKWVRELGGGMAFDSSTGFRLPNGAVRSPDAAWVSQERWNAIAPDPNPAFAPLCPDFVLELRSASDLLKPLQDKMEEYTENGAQLGWLIDPQQQRVELYRPGQAVEVLNAPHTLSGEDVLSGFVLNLQSIYRD